MKTFELSIEVQSSKKAVWEKLFNEFGAISVFNPMVISSFELNPEKSGEVGIERQCNFDSAGNKFVKERISKKWENGFKVDIYEGSLPGLSSMYGEFYIDEKTAESTSIRLKVYFKPKISLLGGIMRKMMKKQFFPVLIGLKYHIETGDNVNQENISAIQSNFESTPNFRFDTQLIMA